MEIVYPDPFIERTQRKSVAWFKLYQSYAAYQTNLTVENAEVNILRIVSNPDDGGRERWDSPQFKGAVDTLVSQAQFSGTFEAILIQKKDDGTFLVLDGHHRLAAWTKLSDSDMIPAVVVTVKPREGYYKSDV